MDLWQFKPGDRVRTSDGALAEVAAETEDRRWIKVRYLADTEDPSLVGTEDLCDDEALVEVVQRSR